MNGNFAQRLVTKRLQAIKRKMLADREVRAAYDALGDEFDLARQLIAVRERAGLTRPHSSRRSSLRKIAARARE